jgi:hypothetical protein
VSDGIFSFACSLRPKEFHLVLVASLPFPFSFIILGFWFSNSQNNEIHNLIISEKLFGSPLKFCHFKVTNVTCIVGSNASTSATDFSFQNLIFWNLFEFSVAEITLKSMSPTF